MTITIVVSAILILTAIVWLFDKTFSVSVCPICAGVSLTWISMLVGTSLGRLQVTELQLPIAILMGGSIVGIAYKLEDKIKDGRSQLVWKSLFISIGFAVVHSLILSNWQMFFGATILLFVVLISFVGRKDNTLKEPNLDSTASALVEKMKKCC